MTESTLIDFPKEKARKTFKVGGIEPIKVDQFDPFYLFLQAAQQNKMIGVSFARHEETTTAEPVAYDKYTAKKLAEMFRIALALDSFGKLLDIRDGRLSKFFALPKPNPDALIHEANQILKPSVDLDRSFLTAYDRWNKKTIDSEDGAIIDEVTIKKMQNDIHNLAREKREQGIHSYSQSEIAEIIGKIFTTTENVFEKRSRLSAQGFNIGFIRNKD